MQRRDGHLNPDLRVAPSEPTLVCGAPMDGGNSCQRRVTGPHRCRYHGGPTGYEDQNRLPDGLAIHKAFDDEAQQAELEKYVASILNEYDLNETADLRQIVLSGIAYVRLLYDGAKMEPKEMEHLSRIVDRHLRNLRATPREQSGGKTPGAGGSGDLANGLVLGTLLERVRGALSPAQLASIAGGKPTRLGKGTLADSGSVTPEPADVEILGNSAPDPFDD